MEEGSEGGGLGRQWLGGRVGTESGKGSEAPEQVFKRPSGVNENVVLNREGLVLAGE